MATWRCPHCTTPQAEASRCWVCGRGTTICSTCSHFRRAVAVKLGYCALDSRRSPLRGDELRPCWATQEVDLVVVPSADPDVLPLR